MTPARRMPAMEPPQQRHDLQPNITAKEKTMKKLFNVYLSFGFVI
jgi:hypothetical protein